MSHQLQDPFAVKIRDVLEKCRKNNDEKTIHWFHENAASIRKEIDEKLAGIRQSEGLPLKAETAFRAGNVEHHRRLEDLVKQDDLKAGRLDWQQEDIIWAILGTEAKSAEYMAYETLKRGVESQARHNPRPH